MDEMEPLSLRMCRDGLPRFLRDGSSYSLVFKHTGEAQVTRTGRLLCNWRNTALVF